MNLDWYQARLRWAMLTDGEGVLFWQEGAVVFRSRNEPEAFQHALPIGRRGEGGGEEQEDGRIVGMSLAEVMTLDCIGRVIPDGFEIVGEQHSPAEPLKEAVEFDPERHIPAASF